MFHGLGSSASLVQEQLESPKAQTAPWVARALAPPDVASFHQTLPVDIQGNAFCGALQLLVPAGLQEHRKISQVIKFRSWPQLSCICEPELTRKARICCLVRHWLMLPA